MLNIMENGLPLLTSHHPDLFNEDEGQDGDDDAVLQTFEWPPSDFGDSSDSSEQEEPMSSSPEAGPSGFRNTIHNKNPSRIPPTNSFRRNSESEDGDSDSSVSNNAFLVSPNGPSPPIPRKLQGMRESIRQCVGGCCKVLASRGDDGWVLLSDSVEKLDVSSWRIGVKVGKATAASRVPLGAMVLTYSLLSLVEDRYRKHKNRSKLSSAEAKAHIQFFTRYDRKLATHQWEWSQLSLIAKEFPLPPFPDSEALIHQRLIDLAIDPSCCALDLSNLCKRQGDVHTPDFDKFDWFAYAGWWQELEEKDGRPEEEGQTVFSRVKRLDMSNNALRVVPICIFLLTTSLESLNLDHNDRAMDYLPTSCLFIPLGHISTRGTSLASMKNVTSHLTYKRGRLNSQRERLLRALGGVEPTGPLSLCELATRRVQSLISPPPDGRAESLDLSSYNLSPICETYVKKSFICPSCGKFIMAPRVYLPSDDGDDSANPDSDNIHHKSYYNDKEVEFDAWFDELPGISKAGGRQFEAKRLRVRGRVCRPCLQCVWRVEFLVDTQRPNHSEAPL